MQAATREELDLSRVPTQRVLQRAGALNVHAISTGTTKITQNWRIARTTGPLRLAYTLLDNRFTDWLPIYCYVIEHPEGLIVVDTGIPANANDPIYFPPYMRLVQRAARFRITAGQEIGPQMRALGLRPEDVRWVVLTHLHQDHEGGLHYFRNAEVVIARAEWEAARGWKGRLAGYLNYRWPYWLAPSLIDFDTIPRGAFPRSYQLTRRGGVHLVPTPGHSAGHLSVLIEESTHVLCIAGDASYAQDLLIADTIDGIGPDPLAQRATHRRIMQFAAERPTVYVPSHEWDAARRLATREPISVDHTTWSALSEAKKGPSNQ
jgi:N-acyl homoserine lactone hydrolase